jgi:quinol monooxygenase YgiN
MSILILLLTSAFVAPAQTPTAAAFSTVTYIEVMPSASSRAITAFTEYQAGSSKQDGYVRFELFQQAGRAGHFVVIETWRDQKAFDTREGAVQKELLNKLQPIRVSDYDQRPYKTLTAAPASANRNAVYVISHVDFGNYPPGPMLLQKHAEESRRDEGNLRFDVLQGTMRMNHLTIIEAWQNQKALEAHETATHTKQYRDVLGPVTGSPVDQRIFEAVEIRK